MNKIQRIAKILACANFPLRTRIKHARRTLIETRASRFVDLLYFGGVTPADLTRMVDGRYVEEAYALYLDLLDRR